jgi:hypothetical protein
LIKEVSMEPALYPSPLKTKIAYFLARREEAITFFTVLCAVSAIGSGIAWLFLKEKPLLYTLMGFSSFYFVGKKFWKFRDGRI